jgi:hypothetical protein
MNKIKQLAVLSVLPITAALIALPAQAAERPACPLPSKAEVKRAAGNKIDKPPRGAAALEGVRVNHIPKGFTYGGVVVSKYHGIVEYGYQWGDERANAESKQRSLWIRVVCWSKASKLTQLKNAPFELGTFGGDTKIVRIGGRKVITEEGDGALGAGRYAGWVERKGVVVTVMASTPLVPELAKIINGIQL